MRTPALLILTPLLTSCGLTTATAFTAIDDLETTAPRSLAEGGHGVPAVPPPGVSWRLTLEGLAETPRDGLPTLSYELRVTLVDSLPRAGRRLPLRLEVSALVDDEGRTFRPSRAGLVNADDAGAARGDRAPPHEYVYHVIFVLPPNYRFQQVVRTTVHWGLHVGEGPPVRISSRFRQ